MRNGRKITAAQEEVRVESGNLSLLSPGSRLLLLVSPRDLADLLIGRPTLLVVEGGLVDAGDELDDGKLLRLRLDDAVDLETVWVDGTVNEVRVCREPDGPALTLPGGLGVVGDGPDTSRPGARRKVEGITLAETAIAETMMMEIECNWGPCPLPDLVKIDDRVAIRLVIVLDREPTLHILGDALEVAAPAIHRLILLTERAAEMDVDLRSGCIRQTHRVHDLAVDAEVTDAVGDDMLTWRRQAVELAWVEAESLVGLTCELAGSFQGGSDGAPVG